MQYFVGTQIVKAKAMSRQEYNNHRGWELPADEDGSDKGYLLEMLEGDGRETWVPAEEFERTFTHVEVDGELPSYQMRVRAERAELLKRCNKLDAFIRSSAFRNIPWEEQGRLGAQRRGMRAYMQALNARIEAFD